MRIHMPEKKEEGVALVDELVQLGDCHVVKVLRLWAAPFCPTSPSGVFKVVVKTSGTGIAAETDASSTIAGFSKDFSQCLNFRSKGSLCVAAQRPEY